MVVYVYGKYDKPKIHDENIVMINPTSHSKSDKYRRLSPFYLGPVEVEPFDDNKLYTSKTFENAWQFSKVYPEESMSDYAYLNWAKKGWDSHRAIRFPKGPGAKPLYSTWKGLKLNYIESRFKIYAPLYAKCVETYASDVIQELQSIHDSGKNIALFDFDGYDYIGNNQSFTDVIYNERRKMGHAFVLAMIITRDKVWEEPFNPFLIHSSSMKKLH